MSYNGREVKKTQAALSPVATFGIVFVVLLFLIGSFAAGYYVGNSFQIDLKSGTIEKTEKDKKEETTVVNYKINDPKIVSTIDTLTKSFGSDCWSVEDFANDRIITANDVSNTRAFAIVENNNYYSSGRTSIPADEVKDEIKKYLGPDYVFVPSSVQYDESKCTQYKYNAEKKQFERKANSANRLCPYYATLIKIIKAIEINDDLEIHVKVLFGSTDGTYYEDYARKNLVTRNINIASSIVYAGSDYLFKFKKSDGKYFFVSSEPISY